VTDAPQDRVDRALAEWRASCPHIDATNADLSLRLLVLGKYLEAHACESFAPLDLQPWEVDVLAALRRQGEPYRLSAGDLARGLLLTGSGMTHRLDRLESRGLLRRSPSKSDRRSVLVTLTGEGRRRVEEALALRGEANRELFACLDAEERAQLTALLRRLTLRFESAED
jgi:DNA-binding MarR family transcriptional regulator